MVLELGVQQLVSLTDPCVVHPYSSFSKEKGFFLVIVHPKQNILSLCAHLVVIQTPLRIYFCWRCFWECTTCSFPHRVEKNRSNSCWKFNVAINKLPLKYIRNRKQQFYIKSNFNRYVTFSTCVPFKFFMVSQMASYFYFYSKEDSLQQLWKESDDEL